MRSIVEKEIRNKSKVSNINTPEKPVRTDTRISEINPRDQERTRNATPEKMAKSTK